VIAAVCALATLAALGATLLGTSSHLLLLVLAALFSGFALTLYSLAVSHVNDKLEPAQMVAASGALLLLNGAAAAIGPTLAGSLIARFGPQAYFATLASLTGGLTLYDLWRKYRKQAVPLAQKGPFIGTQPECANVQIVASAPREAAR
jgi:MFS family permease